MDTIHEMNVEREEELAYNIGEKYFSIQTSEEGYDYTFYDTSGAFLLCAGQT